MLVSGTSAAPKHETSGLLAAVEGALARSRDTRPHLLRVHATIKRSDPWLALRDRDLAGQPFFAWQDGSGGRLFAAWGVACEVRAEGPGRMGYADQRRLELAARTLAVDTRGEEADDELPLFCGGFSFGPYVRSHQGEGAPWAGWPAGWLFVPRIVLELGRSGPTRVAIAEPLARAHPHAAARASRADSPDAICRRIARQLSRLGRLAAKSGLTPEGDRGAAMRLCEADAAKESWLSAVTRARGDLARGVMRKVVLARGVGLQAPDEPFDPLGTLIQLRQHDGVQDGGCTLFAIGRGADEVFLGATPETLLRLRGRELETSALAGTMARETDPARDDALASALERSPKEREEHRFVVDAIVQALERVGCELTVEQAPRVRRLRAIQHLETAIRGRVARPTSLLRLVEALHPTPAVGGWPTEHALRWIAQNERMERGWYAGPVGWMTRAGDGHFVVALRCALIGPRLGWAFAGAGITEGSHAPAEWAETTLKLQTIANALRTAAAPERDAAAREVPL